MIATRLIACFLLGVAAIFLLLAISSFVIPSGNMKGMGAFFLAFFFLAISGWMIGDF